MVNFKITVANSNLARKINTAHEEIIEEESLSKNVVRIKNVMENHLWLLHVFLLTYFSYLSFFEKPYWCNQKGNSVTPNCSEDIYGNQYHLLLSFNFHENYIFLICTIIMLYFNLKFYVSYMNIGIASTSKKRMMRLLGVSILNLAHILFYFMIKDGIITFDGCLFVKTLFLFLVVDILYSTFSKILNYFVNFYEVFIIFLVDWVIMAAII